MFPPPLHCVLPGPCGAHQDATPRGRQGNGVHYARPLWSPIAAADAQVSLMHPARLCIGVESIYLLATHWALERFNYLMRSRFDATSQVLPLGPRLYHQTLGGSCATEEIRACDGHRSSDQQIREPEHPQLRRGSVAVKDLRSASIIDA